MIACAENPAKKSDNPATCGKLIGYRTAMPTARFGSNLVIRKTGNFPFGDREDVIGCHKCVVDLYKPALRGLIVSYAQPELYEAITELERLVDILKQALDGDSRTKVQSCMNAADEIRVGSCMGSLVSAGAYEEVKLEYRILVILVSMDSP